MEMAGEEEDPHEDDDREEEEEEAFDDDDKEETQSFEDEERESFTREDTPIPDGPTKWKGKEVQLEESITEENESDDVGTLPCPRYPRA